MSLLRKGAEAGVQVWRVVWPVTQGVKSRLGMGVEMTEGCPEGNIPPTKRNILSILRKKEKESNQI
jgi:hypothetical protein